MNQNQIKEYLDFLAEKRPDIVRTRLEKGSKIAKGTTHSYEIDDIDAISQLGEFKPGFIPYKLIHSYLKSSNTTEILALFGDRKTIPFSEAVENRLGDCLEKAVLVHLAAQKSKDAYLMSGSLALKGDVAGAHSYNIVYQDNIPLLIDAENPASIDKKGEITPYIFAVKGINSGLGRLVLGEDAPKRFYELL